jgi:hypothetical protein
VRGRALLCRMRVLGDIRRSGPVLGARWRRALCVSVRASRRDRLAQGGNGKRASPRKTRPPGRFCLTQAKATSKERDVVGVPALVASGVHKTATRRLPMMRMMTMSAVAGALLLGLASTAFSATGEARPPVPNIRTVRRVGSRAIPHRAGNPHGLHHRRKLSRLAVLLRRRPRRGWVRLLKRGAKLRNTPGDGHHSRFLTLTNCLKLIGRTAGEVSSWPWWSTCDHPFGWEPRLPSGGRGFFFLTDWRAFSVHGAFGRGTNGPNAG